LSFTFLEGGLCFYELHYSCVLKVTAVERPIKQNFRFLLNFSSIYQTEIHILSKVSEDDVQKLITSLVVKYCEKKNKSQRKYNALSMSCCIWTYITL